MSTKPFYSRLVACACGLALCSLLVAAAFTCPKKVYAADDLQAQTAYNILVAVAENAFADMSAQQVAVVAAQLALSYAYGWCDAASSANPGNAKSYAGLCRDSNNNVYVGSGYINDSASVLSFRINRGGTSITCQQFLTDQSKLPNTMLYPGNRLGVSGGSGTSSFSLSTASGYYWTAPYTKTYEGDPISQGVCVGSAASFSSASFGQTSEVVYALFYDGGYNLSGVGYDTSGSFPDDLQELQTDLRQEYPDVPENYFYTVNGDQDPTVESTENTSDCCDCTHIINIEPTINVEVNVEPTINVDVNVDNDINLPTDWIEGYTFETSPSENVDIPTENESFPLPTDTMDELTDDQKSGLHFWADLWGALLTSSGLMWYFPIFVILSIIEWILWHAGGSKKE